MRSLQVVDLAVQDIHIICLAAPSEKVKPLLYRTSGPAENFWHLLTKTISIKRILFRQREGLYSAERGRKQRPRLQELRGLLWDSNWKEDGSVIACAKRFRCNCVTLSVCEYVRYLN